MKLYIMNSKYTIYNTWFDKDWSSLRRNKHILGCSVYFDNRSTIKHFCDHTSYTATSTKNLLSRKNKVM